MKVWQKKLIDKDYKRGSKLGIMIVEFYVDDIVLWSISLSNSEDKYIAAGKSSFY